MSDDDYLIAAKWAITRAEGLLPLGRSDDDDSMRLVADTVRSGGRNLFNQCLSRLLQPKLTKSNSNTIKKDIATVARLAEEHQVGACIEFAAVTCMILRDADIRPFEFVRLMHHGTTSVHCLVVVGRRWDEMTASLLGPRGSWEGPATICDAWAGVAFRDSATGRKVWGQDKGDAKFVSVARWK